MKANKNTSNTSDFHCIFIINKGLVSVSLSPQKEKVTLKTNDKLLLFNTHSPNCAHFFLA